MISEVQRIFNDYHGIIMTEHQAVGFLLSHPRIVSEINEWGASDTCVRECMADLFSQEMIGKDWICGGDPEPLKKSWIKEMTVVINNSDYKITDGSIFNDTTNK